MKTDTEELDDILAKLGVGAASSALPIKESTSHAVQLDRVLMLAAGERQRVGELLQDAERITATQLEQALDEQRRSDRMLGDILVESRLLTVGERDVLLEFQRRQSGAGPQTDKLYLGKILVATGQITNKQLADALDWQKGHGGRLGEALVATGQATPTQVNHGLTLQRKLVVAALLAALSLASAPAVENAHADSHTTKLTVMARVATFFRMQVEHQAAALTVTELDVERGYVEVPAASSFSVITNTQDGFVINFRPRSDVFRTVLVTGLQNPVEIGAQGGTAVNNVPHGRTTFHQLGYRFMLRPDLQPGSYPWPLDISVRSA
jgi:hypothetical protein